MTFLRILLIHCLVLVMLPWGAWANAVAAVAHLPQHQAVDAGTDVPQLRAGAEEPTLLPKTKRCRIAVLAGISCGADKLWHRTAAFAADGRVLDMVFFAGVVLPQGITASGPLHPPRQG